MAFGNSLGYNRCKAYAELFLRTMEILLLNDEEDADGLSDYGFSSDDYDVIGVVTDDDVIDMAVRA